MNIEEQYKYNKEMIIELADSINNPESIQDFD